VNLVFREIAFLRHVNRETAFSFVVKRDREGNVHLKIKIKAQQMTSRQDIPKR
jgi:hypothetical protein